MLLSIQLQILSTLLAVRDRVVETTASSRDERGELTGNVIFLAALAVAAAAVALIIIAKLNSNADNVPG